MRFASVKAVLRVLVLAASIGATWLAWYLFFPSSIDLCALKTELPEDLVYHRKMVRVTGTLMSTSSTTFFLIRQPCSPGSAFAPTDCWASVSIDEPQFPFGPRFRYDTTNGATLTAFAGRTDRRSHREVPVVGIGRIERLRKACFAPDVVIHARTIAFQGVPAVVNDPEPGSQ